jgi:hypothetical protein
MALRVAALLCVVAAVSMTAAGQAEPALTSANMPMYPPLASQGRVQGIVKITFTLAAQAAEPTNVEVVSGHPMLRGASLENVKTWRFDNHYAIERKYETTLEYRLSGRELTGDQTRRLTVTLESFHKMEIVTDVYEGTVNY